MAATVERLVAELTSQIAPDLLADFFLTFRSYLAPLELMHLLLTRFEWAMKSDPPLPPERDARPALASIDDAENAALRRIVRVRTFVVLRYWLLNHFMQDFYPSRDLRTTLTSWLNESAREERFRSSPRDLRLIKALKRTVRKCKEAYISGRAQRDATAAGRSPVLGTAEDGGDEDRDVDLAVAPDRPPQQSLLSSGQDILAPSEPCADATAVDGGLKPPGPIARRLSDAMSTLGRIKRKLAAVSAKQTRRSAATIPSPEPSLRDGTEGSSADLLRHEDRLHSYLRQLGLELASEPNEENDESAAEISPSNVASECTPASIREAAIPPFDATAPAAVDGHVVHLGQASTSPATGLGILARDEELQPTGLDICGGPAFHTTPATETPSFSLLPGLFGPLVDSARPASVRVELDDLSDSSDDDDDDVIEAKRVMKRLPPARFLEAQTEQVSSADELRSRAVGVSTPEAASRTYSALFVDDEEGYEDGELVTVIPNFILDGLDDSDEENGEGGVEAALRRLEGIVDDARERRHAARVQQQMEKSSKLEEERRQREEGAAVLPSDDSTTTLASDAASPVESVDRDLLPAMHGALNTTRGPPELPTTTTEQSVVPRIDVELAAGRDAQAPSPGRANLTNRLFGQRATSAIATPRALSPQSSHRAFVMWHRTDVIVQHFTLIERDLLRMLSYQELVGGNWQRRPDKIDVLDWETYVKERRRLALAAAERGETTGSAVQDLLARFNLTANWVASEVSCRANCFTLS